MIHGLPCLIFSIFALAAPSGAPEGMVSIPGGNFVPFVLRPVSKEKTEDVKKAPVEVRSFFFDRDLVTNEDFLRFVRTHSEWRRSKVKKLFTDSHYLKSWKSDLHFPKSESRSPATDISWFAARAYCQAQGKDLPTTDEWEFVLFDQGRNQEPLKAKILAWYGKPSSRRPEPIGSTGVNGFGARDLGALVWEWTLDFNSFLAGDELRESGGKDTGLFCGGGSMGTLDGSDYAAFMRYSFRTSLKASYTTGNLGFRCAREILP